MKGLHSPSVSSVRLAALASRRLDVYDPEGDTDHGDFKFAYAGRTRYETVTVNKGTTGDGGQLTETARCSKYDPYDYQYRGGFLRA